ncbi:hypothetical protein D9V41_08795 [Aeromicrobium phragmitis]|uniref:Uncharacterized protein n=1 Tax=Aeromicrobium phragmitis TaxID=2478914 RepID=A0A3L8PMJ1_9ACTN|nr:hypothetical protein [Aeromicrobium phragmitis]RLV55983.1 hypothetical protein D9V41_08795 [Aeromicrobium phragmitis]
MSDARPSVHAPPPHDGAVDRPGGRTAGGGWAWGVVAGLGVLALVAVPAAYAVFFAVVSFTGCFLECSTPSPAVGVMWSALAVGLLSIPVLVGAFVARRSLRRTWPVVMALVVIVAVAVGLLQRVA